MHAGRWPTLICRERYNIIRNNCPILCTWAKSYPAFPEEQQENETKVCNLQCDKYIGFSAHSQAPCCIIIRCVVLSTALAHAEGENDVNRLLITGNLIRNDQHKSFRHDLGGEKGPVLQDPGSEKIAHMHGI